MEYGFDIIVHHLGGDAEEGAFIVLAVINGLNRDGFIADKLVAVVNRNLALEIERIVADECRTETDEVDGNIIFKGQNITVERPLELYDKAKMLYAVSYDGLRATEMRTIVSAAIYRNGERVSKTVEYSIESYGGRNPSDLCRAMLAYGDSANIFFAN